MEIANTPQMTPEQSRALTAYCDSATIFNDYKPKTFEELSKLLKQEGIQVSSSTLQRWSKQFNWKDHLKVQLQTVMVEDKDKTIQQQALRSMVKSKLVDVKRNGELSAKFYDIMEAYVEQVKEDYENGKRISAETMKFAIAGATMTTGREDKLLDRIANSSGHKVSSDEILKRHQEIVLDIEED